MTENKMAKAKAKMSMDDLLVFLIGRPRHVPTDEYRAEEVRLLAELEQAKAEVDAAKDRLRAIQERSDSFFWPASSESILKRRIKHFVCEAAAVLVGKPNGIPVAYTIRSRRAVEPGNVIVYSDHVKAIGLMSFRDFKRDGDKWISDGDTFEEVRIDLTPETDQESA